jgi:hypothetical protein
MASSRFALNPKGSLYVHSAISLPWIRLRAMISQNEALAEREITMADLEHYIAGIKKYTSPVDAEAVAGIVKHLGIALKSRDATFVASTDPEELKRVRESWLKKKLGLADSDAELDKAIGTVVTKMKADRMKERVTVYYLLAQHFNKLSTLHKIAAPQKKSA